MKNININKILKKKPFILAPMDMATDICFRELCEKQGAGFTVTELISVESLIRNKVPSYRYERGDLKINSVQLFGSNLNSFAKAVKLVEDEADIIDINFGCPSNNVVGNNAGSSLLKDPKKMGQIAATLIKNTNLPVSAKIRIGYNSPNYKETVKELEDNNIDFITVHGRTKKQKYSGKADWNIIKEIYENTKIPIIGNGDIREEEDIDAYLGTHAQGLMIGRAAIGNPFIFKRFNHYNKTKEKLKHNQKYIQKKLFAEYIKKLEKKDFYRKDLKIRQQSMWFFKGIEGAKELRKEIVHETDTKKIFDAVKRF